MNSRPTPGARCVSSQDCAPATPSARDFHRAPPVTDASSPEARAGRRQQDASSGNQDEAHDEDGGREQKGLRLVAQGAREHGLVEPARHAHDGIVVLTMHPAADEKGRQHGHESHGEDRRPDHREGLREGEGMKELAFLTRQRKDGEEREKDDDHGEEDRASDLPGGVPHDLDDRLSARVGLIVAKDVLRDDDAGVHEDADGDGDPTQRHDVRRDAEDFHQEERRQDRQRERQRHDQDRSKVQQEDDVGEGHEEDFLDEGLPQGADGPRDQRRAVVERQDLHAGRQTARDLGELLLDTPDDLRRALAVSHRDDAADDFLALLFQRAAPEFRPQRDGAEIRDVDGSSSAGGHDDLLDIGDVVDEAEPPHDVLEPAPLEHLAAHVVVRHLHGLDHVADRQAISREAIRVHVDLVLPDETSDRSNLGDAGDGVQLVAHVPVLDRAQRPQVLPLGLDGVPEDLAHRGRVGAEHRGDAPGKQRPHEVETLENAGPGEVEIGAVLQDDVDHREAKRRGRPDGPQAGEALKIHDHRVRHLVLHFLG